MVHIPVENQHALVVTGERGRDHRDVVEQAEPLAARSGGVVTGRPHRDECRFGPAVAQGLDRHEPGARREERGVERALRHGCVGIEVTASGSCEPLDRVEVVRVVHRLDLVSRRRPGGLVPEGVAERHVTDPTLDGLNPRRSFGVPASRVVAVASIDGSDEHT